MGTVGLTFGSATSGTGFDVASTVTQILAASGAVETPWKNQLTSLGAQDAALSTIGTDLATLTTKLQALTDFDGVLAAKQGASSNTNVLALTGANSTAVAGSHTVVVNQLAQTSSQFTQTIGAADTLSGSLTIQVGGGAARTVTLDSSNNTLAGLVSAINDANAGVTARVVTDTTGSRLSLVSNTSGAAGAITLSGTVADTTKGSNLSFSIGQTAQDASLDVDGITVTSASNTVTSAIPGVTMQLLSTAVGSPVQVQITNDNSSVESAMSDFVTAYNAVVKDLSTQEGKDASGNAEPLYGSPTVALLQGQLAGAVLGGAASGSISSITQLGITLGSDGTLTLDPSALESALNNNYSDVTGFLQNSGSFGQNFARVLNNVGGQAPNGATYLALQQNAQQETALNTSISNEDALLAAEKTTLTAELNAANQTLQQIPQQLDYVNKLYDAAFGNNNSN